MWGMVTVEFETAVVIWVLVTVQEKVGMGI